MSSYTKRLTALALAAGLVQPLSALAGETKGGIMYKNPQCGCCEEHAEYLRENGFEITVKPTHDLSLINRNLGVPKELRGCHTILIDNYVVSGHVPAETIRRLLTERPSIKGISLQGMPNGSPGMSGQKTAPFTIYEIGSEKVYAVE